jgi:hypothetical protein
MRLILRAAWLLKVLYNWALQVSVPSPIRRCPNTILGKTLLSPSSTIGSLDTVANSNLTLFSNLNLHVTTFSNQSHADWKQCSIYMRVFGSRPRSMCPELLLVVVCEDHLSDRLTKATNHGKVLCNWNGVEPCGGRN